MELKSFAAGVSMMIRLGCCALGLPTVTKEFAILWNSVLAAVFSLEILDDNNVNDF